MKSKNNNIIKIPKGFFFAGGVIYPDAQFKEVFAAQLNNQPLPKPKNK